MAIDMTVEIDGDGSAGTSPSRQGAGTKMEASKHATDLDANGVSMLINKA